MAVTILSYPLNETDYTAEDARLFHATRTSGIFSSEEDFIVSPSLDQPVQISVSPGLAWARFDRFGGAVVANKETQALNLVTAHATLPRIDRVVIRYSMITNDFSLDVKTGTPASSPVAPALQRDGDIYELGIADISVTPSTITLTAANITDQRLNETLCGIMRDGVTRIPTQTLYDSWYAWMNSFKSASQSDFEAWFETIRDQLSTDAAGNLQLQIDNINGQIPSFLKRSDLAFTYFCTGTGDDKAIQKIINDFHADESGPAYMRLTVVGNFGFTKTFAEAAHIQLQAAAIIKRIYLDFTNCQVKGNGVTLGKNFMRIGQGVNLYINGLRLFAGSTSTGENNTYVLFYYDNSGDLAGTGSLHLENCYISGYGNVIHYEGATVSLERNNFIRALNGKILDIDYDYCSVNIGPGNELIGMAIVSARRVQNIMIRGYCSLTAPGVGIELLPTATGVGLFIDNAVQMTGSTYGILVATSTAKIFLLGGSYISGGLDDVNQDSPANTVKWHIVGCRFSKSDGLRINGSSRFTSTPGTAFVYMPPYGNFFG